MTKEEDAGSIFFLNGGRRDNAINYMSMIRVLFLVCGWFAISAIDKRSLTPRGKKRPQVYQNQFLPIILGLIMRCQITGRRTLHYEVRKVQDSIIIIIIIISSSSSSSSSSNYLDYEA